LKRELFDEQLSGTRQTLPVDVPPVVAATVLPQPRELVAALAHGTSRPGLYISRAQRKPRQVVNLRVDYGLGAVAERADEVEKSERVRRLDQRRA
jgi:hypothetical protein